MIKEPGRFIDLYWDDSPSAYYVRGHVTPEQFARAVEPFLGVSVREDLSTVNVEHGWARWVPTPHGPADRILREELSQKRGCFAVTVVRSVES